MLLLVHGKSARRALMVFVAAACVVVAGESGAQTNDRALAQSLFEEARRLMDAGDHAAACPKLAESQRLDPAGGTLLNLGLCYEAEGKTASAWAVLEDAVAYARKDGHKQREQIARRHLEAIKPVLSYLTIEVPAAEGVPDVRVTLDGSEIPRAAWGTRFPIDPGVHRLEASAPDRAAYERTVEIKAKSDQQTVTIPPWQEAKTAPAAVPSRSRPKQPTSAPASTPERVSPDEGQGGGNATLGYIVGGTGVVLIGVGSYFGVKAISTWSDRNDHCPDGRCDAEAVSLGDDANTQGHISNATIGVGLVGVVVGGYLLLSGPESGDGPDESAGVKWSPTAAKDSVGMRVGGAF